MGGFAPEATPSPPSPVASASKDEDDDRSEERRVGKELVWVHCVRGSVVIFFFRDVVRILCMFSFLSLLDTLFLHMRSCAHL